MKQKTTGLRRKLLNSTPPSPNDDDPKPTIAPPLNECTAHLVKPFFREKCLRMTFKSTSNLGSKLVKRTSQNTTPTSRDLEVVYSISCREFPEAYLGQTEKKLSECPKKTWSKRKRFQQTNLKNFGRFLVCLKIKINCMKHTGTCEYKTFKI